DRFGFYFELALLLSQHLEILNVYYIIIGHLLLNFPQESCVFLCADWKNFHMVFDLVLTAETFPSMVIQTSALAFFLVFYEIFLNMMIAL
ncbi:hypothetical protein ACJX0J_005815, partial [Zea mays]